ncbi:Metallo-hydrolase/oxidoreductase [Microstroma glucosiphilum]|uniref:Metallo-hydrolase/oxidoreductase n=1 Tax=Pseudomicrostroma glucosiphilum TaxID=1684307 RepID=A0A316UBA4_9BASI|nr:Metallo-hydrolase/oxidoreductase [Pseudomicrostroma glucosiphilum]PWN22442.1 Metallo-hydrolase/oxidoreductase [Pseudomicrostroma glucosiphilum]
MDTGCGRNIVETWGPVADVFAPEQGGEEYELDTAIKNLGYDIKDVKKVIMGHLHLDHAGGLTYFTGTDTEIWVHKIELENAFYSAATKADSAVYMAHYLQLSLNWKCFTGQTYDFAPGLTIHHLPGHCLGLCGLQVNLQDTGTLIFLNDHAHIQENYDGSPPGWLVRDYQAWFESNQRIKKLQKTTAAQVFPGHDLMVSKLYGKVWQ